MFKVEPRQGGFQWVSSNTQQFISLLIPSISNPVTERIRTALIISYSFCQKVREGEKIKTFLPDGQSWRVGVGGLIGVRLRVSDVTLQQGL